ESNVSNNNINSSDSSDNHSALYEKYKDAKPLKPKKWGKRLINYVSKTQDVQKSDIQILKQYDTTGHGEYVVRVNGKYFEYKRGGTAFYTPGSLPF
ncbi:MAG: hypothetical protein HRT90_02560, partial [Candidatus Margulisbacteria bacterium]|nr:hypothetical protein [Candidatus Margulisiibacteriota bacterium]